MGGWQLGGDAIVLGAVVSDSLDALRDTTGAPTAPLYEAVFTDRGLVGPLTLDDIHVAVAKATLSQDAKARLVGTNNWLMVREILSRPTFASAATKPVEEPAVPALPAPPATLIAAMAELSATPRRRASVAPTPTRYANLHSVSESLRSYGTFLKFLGVLAGVGGVIGGYMASGKLGVLALGLVMAIGIVAGVALHATGTFIAAMGEGLLALADIATNTARGDA